MSRRTGISRSSLAVLSFAPLLVCILAGRPKGTAIALFPAALHVFYQWLRRLEKQSRGASGDARCGIVPRNLCIAAAALSPLLASPPVDAGKSTCLALFASCCAGLYLTLGFLARRARPVFTALASLAVFWAAVNHVYFRIVGDFIGYQVFASVFDTNTGETLDFLTSGFSVRFIPGLLGTLAAFWALCRLAPATAACMSLLPPSLVKAAALSVWLATLFHLPRSKAQIADFYPLREANHLIRYLTEVHFLVRDYRNLTHHFDGTIDKSRSPLVILLIGEAARRDKMGIYGSGHSTTPGLEEFARKHPEHLLLFTDAVAASSYTRVSVPSMLSVTDAGGFGEIARHPSILRILKSAGLETTLVSNQPRRGFHDNFISSFMEDAARTTYLQDHGKQHDAALIPPLLAELRRPSHGPGLVICHLAGSHFNYQDNYPPDDAFHSGTSILNHYLNSIRYTDKVMSCINTAIMDADRPVMMLYAPDHGEYLNDYGDGFYDHGNRRHLTRFEIEIPFLITFNRSFLMQWNREIVRMRERTATPVSHDNISHTLLGLMGVKDRTYRANRDLSSLTFAENQRHIVERTNRITPLEKVRFDRTKFTGRLD